MAHKNLEQWIAHIEAVRPAMNALANSLEICGAKVEPKITNVVGELPYIARFQFPNAVTSIFFLLKDHQSDSDIVITNMTTLPTEQCRQGYGSQAIQQLLAWATGHQLNEVRATQIGNQASESFWEKNGFRKCPVPNPCNDFVFTLPKQTTPD